MRMRIERGMREFMLLILFGSRMKNSQNFRDGVLFGRRTISSGDGFVHEASTQTRRFVCSVRGLLVSKIVSFTKTYNSGWAPEI